MLAPEHTNAKGIQELYREVYSENLLKARKNIASATRELIKGKYWFRSENEVKRRKRHEKHDKCIVPDTPPVVSFIMSAEVIHEKYCTKAVTEANRAGEFDVEELLREKAGDRVCSYSEIHHLTVAIHDIYQTHYKDVLYGYTKSDYMETIYEINELVMKFSVYEYDPDTCDSMDDEAKLINKKLANELKIIQKKHYNQALKEATKTMDGHRPEDKDFDETQTQFTLHVKCYNETEKQTIPLAKFKCRMCGGKSVISPDEDNEYFCPICGVQLG